jgi:hypothetical protein
VDYPVSNPFARILMIAPGVLGSAASYNLYKQGQAGYSWVENAIDEAREKNIRWIIVGMHKNFISVLVKTAEVGKDLMSLLFDKRVDLILQGHEHGYERTKQLTCAYVNNYNASCVADVTPAVQGKGTTIVVLGTGGQALRTKNVRDPEWSYFQVVDVTTYGFGHFLVTADKIAYNFRKSFGGSLRDSFTLKYPVVLAPTEEGNETETYPTPEPPAASRFVGNAAAIISVICLFLICMAVLAVGTVVYMVCKPKMAAHVGTELGDVDHPKQSSKASKAKKQTEEGSIDYL